MLWFTRNIGVNFHICWKRACVTDVTNTMSRLLSLGLSDFEAGPESWNAARLPLRPESWNAARVFHIFLFFCDFKWPFSCISQIFSKGSWIQPWNPEQLSQVRTLPTCRWMYLSNLTDVFVQFNRCICPI